MSETKAEILLTNDAKFSVLIELNSEQWSRDEKAEPVKLTTVGEMTYTVKNQAWHVSYDESEATGMAGTRTRLSRFPDGSIRLYRQGMVEMDLHFTKGMQHQSQISTEYGLFDFSIITNELQSEFNSEGGLLRLVYSLSFDHKESVSTRILMRVTRSSIN